MSTKQLTKTGISNRHSVTQCCHHHWSVVTSTYKIQLLHSLIYIFVLTILFHPLVRITMVTVQYIWLSNITLHLPRMLSTPSSKHTPNKHHYTRSTQHYFKASSELLGNCNNTKQLDLVKLVTYNLAVVAIAFTLQTFSFIITHVRPAKK